MIDEALALAARSAVVLVAAGLTTVWMRRAAASARHAVWAAALLGLLLLPALSRTLPRLELPVLPAAASPAEPPIVRPAPATIVADSAEPGLVDAPVFDPAPAQASTVPPVTPPPTLPTAGTLALWIWQAGMVFGLLHALIGNVSVWQTVRRATPIADAGWTGPLARAAARLGLTRVPGLRRSARVAVPLVWGFRRPVILVPPAADEWPEERRWAFLLHEVAHVARRDCLVHALAAVAHSVYWPNPLVWWGVRCLRREAERACDDRVVSAGAEAAEYAQHLLEAAKRLRDVPRGLAHGAAIVERTSLSERLLALLDDRLDRGELTRRRFAATAAMAVVAVASVAATQPVARAAMASVIRAAADAASPQPEAAAPAEPAAPTATAVSVNADAEPAITGVVQTPDGGPAAEALVVAWEPEPWTDQSRPLFARTDVRGAFRMAASPAKRYRLGAYLHPFAAEIVSEATTSGSVQMRLPRGRVLEGRVLDGRRSEPIAGARVSVGSGLPMMAAERGAGLIEATTDASGRYRLEGVGSQPYMVTAVASGYAAGSARASAGAEAVDVRLFPGASLSGTVTAPNGDAVQGAFVSSDADPAGAAPPPVRTDRHGRFMLLGLSPRPHRILVNHPAWAPVFVPGIEADTARPMSIRLERGVRVRGRIVADGNPVAGRFALQTSQGAEVPLLLSQHLRAHSGPDGVFTLYRVPTGRHTFVVDAQGYGSAHVDVDATRGDASVELGDVRLQPGAIIRGVVRDDKRAPIAGARVLARPLGGFSTVTSDKDGAFVLAGLEAGVEQLLSVSAEGYARAQVQARPGKDPLDVVLQREGIVVGRIVDGSNRPVESFATRLRKGPSSGPMSGGRFRIVGIAPGTYVLEIQGERHLDKVVPDIEVVAGRETDVGNIVLADGSAVKGVVVDAQGTPVAGATVEASKRMSNFIPAPRSVSDPAGRFELVGLPIGRTTLTADHPDFAVSEPLAVEIGDKGLADVRITLVRGGRIEGIARRRDGSPVPGSVVGCAGEQRNRTSPVRADGTFVLERVRPGLRRVQLFIGSSGSYMTLLSKEVDVSDGATASVDLSPRVVRVRGRVTRGGKAAAGHVVAFQGRNNSTSIFSSGGLRPSLTAPDLGLSRQRVTTGEDGRYEAIVPQAGEYRVVVRAADPTDGTERRSSFTLPDVETFEYDIALPDQAATGRVIDRATRRPIERAMVTVEPAAGMGQISAVTSESDGRFTVMSDPGEHRLRVTASGYVPYEKDLTFGGPAVEATFELDRGQALVGEVKTATGVIAERASVVAVAVDGATYRDGQTGVNGRFELDGLAPGAYNVFVDHEDGNALRSDVSPGDTPVSLTLTRGAQVRLVFKDENGSLITDGCTRLDIVRIDGRRTGAERAPGVCIGNGNDGSRTVGLPLGAVELLARNGDLRAEAQLVIAPSMSDVTLTMKPAR